MAAGQPLLDDDPRQAGDDAVDLVELALRAASAGDLVGRRAQVGEHVLRPDPEGRATRAGAGDDAAEPTSQFRDVDHTAPPRRSRAREMKKSLSKRQTLSNAYGVSCRVRA